MKISCPPAENINETPALSVLISFYGLKAYNKQLAEKGLLKKFPCFKLFLNIFKTG